MYVVCASTKVLIKLPGLRLCTLHIIFMMFDVHNNFFDYF